MVVNFQKIAPLNRKYFNKGIFIFIRASFTIQPILEIFQTFNHHEISSLSIGQQE
jgi:hypothetical protein